MLQRRQPHHQAALIKVVQLEEEKKKVAGDVLILLNDGKEHQSAQNIFLPNFCHDGLGYVFSSGSGMQVRLPSHVWFWGQFCSECFSNYG